MRHLSISIDKDLQRTFLFFEKLPAKPGGLNILASRDAAFSSLIQSFPRLLHLSIDNHLTHILDSLHNFGIPSVDNHLTHILDSLRNFGIPTYRFAKEEEEEEKRMANA